MVFLFPNNHHLQDKIEKMNDDNDADDIIFPPWRGPWWIISSFVFIEIDESNCNVRAIREINRSMVVDFTFLFFFRFIFLFFPKPGLRVQLISFIFLSKRAINSFILTLFGFIFKLEFLLRARLELAWKETPGLACKYEIWALNSSSWTSSSFKKKHILINYIRIKLKITTLFI